ncbi:MAG TPA: isoprenylcysteine carboxylmethyltransferase family protein [Hanamia sp.]|nr:isoprenylcysteine carboxylmethyltransferase family protein [Hanamia sp.]
MKNPELIFKTTAGVLFLFVAMGIALFLPRESFDYIRAWVYLAAFFIPVLVITIYIFRFDKRLLESRLAVGPISEKKKIQKLIQAIAGIAFISVYVISSLDNSHKWSEVSFPVSLIADAIILIAFIFLFYVFKKNTFLSATIEVQEKQKVISTGLYGIIRHPMYTGAIILLGFTPLALGSWWGLLSVIILIVVIILRAIDEEEELRQNLEGYEAYCNKVKYRLIPFIF